MNDAQYDISAKTATCILAPACFALGAEVFADYEGGLVGVQSSNLSLETSNFTYAACVGMLFFDAVLYGVLAWYLDNVLPSEFGTPLPLYFFLMPSYWFGTSSKAPFCFGLFSFLSTDKKSRYSRATSSDGADDAENTLGAGLMDGAEIGSDGEVEKYSDGRGAFIEPVSAELRRQVGMQSCLSISALRKVYKSAAGGDDRVAVDKLNMNLYQGHVTVLLGHNGAGKTTTISMLVGLIPPSAGNAFFPGGLSIMDDMHEIRQNLGVCPQHDILFPELTTMQHLEVQLSWLSQICYCLVLYLP